MNQNENDRPLRQLGPVKPCSDHAYSRGHSPDSPFLYTSKAVFCGDSFDSDSSHSSPPSEHFSSDDEKPTRQPQTQTQQEPSLALRIRPANQQNRPAVSINELVNAVNSEAPVLQSRQQFHPRRPRPTGESTVLQTLTKCPPQLVRQCDRAQNFVESLVDTATQMIEVIWPMSISHCDRDYLGGKNLIGLRTFIQEVLKRSKTSYYTLQVALYYLILVKPCLPKMDFTQSQSQVPLPQRAMHCGRRMFLAALILASKYLQDRNYSARAWSKISGLKVQEINSNEMAFLHAVNWNLHIPEALFNRWSNIVFKYSTSQSSSAISFRSYDSPRLSWRQIIPRLTPELDEVDLEQFSRMLPKAWGIRANADLLGVPRSPGSVDGDQTPTPPVFSPIQSSTSPSSTLSWSPEAPRPSALSTPALTPQISSSSLQIPRSWSHGQAMHDACLQVQDQAFKSYSSECYPTQPYPQAQSQSRSMLARVTSSGSLISSPESMVSDFTQSSYSSRTSRSSSISSMAPSVRALADGVLPVLHANHRSAMAALNAPQYSTSLCVEPCLGPEDLCLESSNLPHKAERDAMLALMSLSGDSPRTGQPPSSESFAIYQPVQRKRARPSSTVGDEDICNEVRQFLQQSSTNNQDTVTGDNTPLAPIFTLSRPEFVKGSLTELRCNQARDKLPCRYNNQPIGQSMEQLRAPKRQRSYHYSN